MKHEPQTLRIGAIGCGPFASTYHFPAIAAISELQLAAFCSRSATRAQVQAQRYGCADVYTDFRKMLDESELDGVCIVGPPQLHVEAAKECLIRKLPFMTEKPLAATLEEARSVARLAAEHGDCGMVGYTSRCCPVQRLALRVSQQPDFGKLVYVATTHLTMAAMHPVWDIEDPVESFVNEQGVHAIDLWRYFGGNPAVVAANVAGLQKRFDAVYSGSVLATVRNPDGGPHGTIHMKAGASHNGDINTDIMGERTRLRVSNNQALDYERRPEWAEALMEDDVLAGTIPHDATATSRIELSGLEAPSYYPDFFRFEWLSFARSVRGGVALSPSITDAYHTACLTESICRSLRDDGAPVQVDYSL